MGIGKKDLLLITFKQECKEDNFHPQLSDELVSGDLHFSEGKNVGNKKRQMGVLPERLSACKRNFTKE